VRVVVSIHLLTALCTRDVVQADDLLVLQFLLISSNYRGFVYNNPLLCLYSEASAFGSNTTSQSFQKISPTIIDRVLRRAVRAVRVRARRDFNGARTGARRSVCAPNFTRIGRVVDCRLVGAQKGGRRHWMSAPHTILFFATQYE